jgi:hypothetical protein
MSIVAFLRFVETADVGVSAAADPSVVIAARPPGAASKDRRVIETPSEPAPPWMGRLGDRSMGCSVSR